MPRELKILKEGGWFLGRDDCEGYPVSYRYALCYSLRNYLEKCNYDDEAKGKEALGDLRACINAGSTYSESYFIELLPLRDGGFVVVDQADGIFPLVLYPDNRSDIEKRLRVLAYENSVVDVIDKYDAIYRFFRAHSTEPWDPGFQQNLWRAAGFQYPPVRSEITQ